MRRDLYLAIMTNRLHDIGSIRLRYRVYAADYLGE